MGITVEKTYELLFKYFDKSEDSTKKKAAKLCASIAIGVFTLGIYHLTIGLWHRHNVKKIEAGQTDELSSSELCKASSEASSSTKSSTGDTSQTQESADATSKPSTPKTPSRKSSVSSSSKASPPASTNLSESSESLVEVPVVNPELQAQKEQQEAERQQRLAAIQNRLLAATNTAPVQPVSLPEVPVVTAQELQAQKEQQNAERQRRLEAFEKRKNNNTATVPEQPVSKPEEPVDMPLSKEALERRELLAQAAQRRAEIETRTQEILESCNSTVDRFNEDNSPAARFQLLKWERQGRNVGRNFSESERVEIVKSAANAGIPEARYLHALSVKGERSFEAALKDRAFKRHCDALQKGTTGEAQFYFYLLSGQNTLGAFQTMKAALLKSECEEGLYQLYCSKEKSRFPMFRLDNSGVAQALAQSFSKGHVSALFEKGRILRGDFGQEAQQFHLSQEEMGHSSEKRIEQGLSLIERAAIKGHKAAIEAMIELSPEASAERAVWERILRTIWQ